MGLLKSCSRSERHDDMQAATETSRIIRLLTPDHTPASISVLATPAAL